MSALETMEAVQTTVSTVQDPTAVSADIMLTWTLTGGTAPVDLDSHRMMLQSPVMVSQDCAGILRTTVYM